MTSEQNINTIFEQNGVVYAVCSHNVSPSDLAKFISTELRHIHKIPGAKMRTATTEEVRSMPFGSPVYPGRVKRNRPGVK